MIGKAWEEVLRRDGAWIEGKGEGLEISAAAREEKNTAKTAK